MPSIVSFPCALSKGRLFPALSLGLLTLIAAACGGVPVAESVSASPAIEAALAVGAVDTKFFETVIPQGWEILSNDIDSMGLMTLAEKGTGGAQGVYIKFEPGFTADPMAKIEEMAGKYDGSPAFASTRNGIDWASTRYTYSGISQTMNLTAHNGFKVTFTVMGDDYSTDPGVRAIFDGLTLK